MSLEGKTALVTGATRGIGQAIARALAAQGAEVVGTATSEAGAESITNDLQSAGYKGDGIVMNVADPASIEAGLKELTDEFGAITVLVNNAGITRDNLLMMMKDEQWDEIIQTNLTSVFKLSKSVIRPMMKARRGRIICIGSVVGLTGDPGQTNYSAAKAGLLGFTKSLAREIGSRNITVNTVAPGFIDTDMTRELPEEQREALTKQIPLNKLGDPQDIANAVAFLASPLAAYITGETINVNGGMYMP